MGGSAEDLQFLWGVLYCAKLKASWLRRLRETIATLLASSGWRERFVSEADADTVASVLRAWADNSTQQPALPAVLAGRRQHLTWWFKKKTAEAGRREVPLEKALEAFSGQLAATVMKTNNNVRREVTMPVAFSRLAVVGLPIPSFRLILWCNSFDDVGNENRPSSL